MMFIGKLTWVVVAGCIAITFGQTCDSNAVCEKTDTGFSCTCNSGYEGTVSGCLNIDECTNSSVCKGNENCTDTPGNYVCHCGNITHICAANAECMTFGGIKSCQCINGYFGDGVSCNDINECDDATTCGDKANCTNTNGSFSCICEVGYTGNGSICNDINECVTGNYACSLPFTCNNTQGSYECTCGISSSCGTNEQCVAAESTSSCVCNDGYIDDNGVCIDADECNAEGTCGEHANCTDTIGSFTCTCTVGFAGNGSTCEDVNECETDINTCIPPLVCNNTPGNFSCVCGDDITCDNEATCLTSENSTGCECNNGYTGDGVQCNDIDECANSMNECDINAECTNTNGNYACACKVGYKGNGKTCSGSTVVTLSTSVLVIVVAIFVKNL